MPSLMAKATDLIWTLSELPMLLTSVSKLFLNVMTVYNLFVCLFNFSFNCLSFSISSIIRHYRVTPKHTGGFLIDVDNPVSIEYLHFIYNISCTCMSCFSSPACVSCFWDFKGKLSSVQVLCATLHDVIHYLVEKSDGVLTPLIFEETYEKNICM